MGTSIANIVLTDLKRFTFETCKQTHASEKIADSCANAAIKVITLNFKNRLMYVPSGHTVKKVKDHHIIRKEFNGTNHAELAIKYQRSLQNIYSILKSKTPVKLKRPITIGIIEDYMPVEFIRFGLSEDEAETLAKNIAEHLQQTFPGVSIYASSANNMV